MIVDAFVGLVHDLLVALLGLLPDWNVDSFVASATAGSGHMGALLGNADAVVPVSETFAVLGMMVALVPIMFGYTLFKWVWRHIPVIAGFGTGAG